LQNTQLKLSTPVSAARLDTLKANAICKEQLNGKWR